MSEGERPPPPTISSGITCWICLEEGPDETGQPVTRDCSCRGNSAGFAHLACIIRYAQSKLNDALKKFDRNEECSLTDAADAWTHCVNCRQKYMGELCLSLCEAHVESTDHLPNNHTARMLALYASASGNLRAKNYDGARRLYEMLVGLGTSRTALFFQAKAVQGLGDVYKKQGKLFEALEKYENARDCGGDEETRQELLLEIETLKIQTGMSDVDPTIMVEMARREWQRESALYGKASNIPLIVALINDNQYIEALKLCKENLDKNERTYGADHNVTHCSRGMLADAKKAYR